MAIKDAKQAADPSPAADDTLDEGLDTNQPADAGDGDDTESSQSSGEQRSEQDESTLSIIRDVADKSEERPSAGSQPGEEGEEGQQPSGKQKEPDDENYSDVPFHKHPRFQQVLHRAKSNEHDADQYRKVQSFIDENGLTPEEAADGLVLMSLMKTNPTEAWKQLRPHVEKLLVAAGEIVPDDLQQRVNAGELTKEAALEVSRLRAANATAEFQQQFREHKQQRQQVRETVSAVQNAAAEWERDRQTKDPNFASKFEPLQKEILYLQRKEGIPDTPQGVKEQLDRAYKSVNAALRPVAAPPRQRREVKPIMGGQVSGNTRPEPKNTLEVIRAARAKA